MNKRHRKLNIGSVSHATMRPEDLIPSFIWELKSQTPTRRKHLKLIREIESNIGRYDGEKSADSVEFYYQSDECTEHLQELFEALDEYAPPYFYFGSHPGDGSDYGFWLAENFQDDFDGLKVDGISEVPRGYTGECLIVNDHGNMSLYVFTRGRITRTCWDLV